jgi:hypothetical protein
MFMLGDLFLVYVEGYFAHMSVFCPNLSKIVAAERY